MVRRRSLNMVVVLLLSHGTKAGHCKRPIVPFAAAEAEGPTRVLLPHSAPQEVFYFRIVRVLCLLCCAYSALHPLAWQRVETCHRRLRQTRNAAKHRTNTVVLLLLLLYEALLL